MISPWTIYWITRLDALRDVLQSISALSVIIAAVTLFFMVMIKIDESWDEWGKFCTAFFIPSLILLIISGIGYVAMPSTKEACAIYIIPKIVNNEQVQQVPENALKFLSSQLEEWVREAAPVKGTAVPQKD